MVATSKVTFIGTLVCLSLQSQWKKQHPTLALGGLGIFEAQLTDETYTCSYTKAIPPVDQRLPYTEVPSCVQNSQQHRTQHQVWHVPKWYSSSVAGCHRLHTYENRGEQTRAPLATNFNACLQRTAKVDSSHSQLISSAYGSMDKAVEHRV